MVNDGNNQLSNIPDNIVKKKMLFVISYLDGTTFKPRLENFLENTQNDQKLKMHQMFHSFDNVCIYNKKRFGNQNEEKTIKKQFLFLKQTNRQWCTNRNLKHCL